MHVYCIETMLFCCVDIVIIIVITITTYWTLYSLNLAYVPGMLALFWDHILLWAWCVSITFHVNYLGVIDELIQLLLKKKKYTWIWLSLLQLLYSDLSTCTLFYFDFYPRVDSLSRGVTLIFTCSSGTRFSYSIGLVLYIKGCKPYRK